jgi:hypothetical protein
MNAGNLSTVNHQPLLFDMLDKFFLTCFNAQIEILEFQKIVKSFIEKFDSVAKLVEQEKMRVRLKYLT